MAALVNDSTGLESLPQFIDCDTRERERELVRNRERGGGRRGDIIYMERYNICICIYIEIESRMELERQIEE